MDENSFFQAIQSDAVSGAYLLCGEESYSQEQAVRQLLGRMDESTRDLNVTTLKNPEAHEVINACDTLPFFSERRMVRVVDLSADAATGLSEYAQKVPETTILLLIFTSKPNAQSALYKALAKADRVVEFERFTPERATAFLEKRASAQGASLDRVAARRLIERVGTSLGALESTLTRLIDYAGPNGRVSVEAVEACVPAPVEATVFSILDALISGNRRTAVTGLTELIKSGADSPMRLASFFEGRLKQMLIAKQMLSAGETEQSIIKALGGSPYAAKKTVQNARKCTLGQLVSGIENFSSVDALQKQGAIKDDDALFLAFFSFSNAAAKRAE